MNNSINILIIEDNIGDARLVGELLKEIDLADYDVTYIKDLEDIDSINGVPYDVILLDLHLADTTPLHTFKLVNQLFPRTPIIVLTGLEDEVLSSKIVRLGAQDYLVKGTFGPNTLRRTITYSIERKKSQLRYARIKHKSELLQVQADSLEDETKRLEEINNAKDVFLSIASHQLRTPATAVKQYIGMLLEGFAGNVTARQRKFLQTAYQNNERQIKIVDDLLRIAKLEAHHITLRKQATDLNLLIRSIIDDQATVFSSKQQIVDFKPLAQDELVSMDENYMRMVFENLLDNASKYSPENSIIRVRIEVLTDKLAITVIDQGIGIEATEKDKLFKKFGRLDSSFKHAPNGSGLGLYWAQEIIKLHGGSIIVQSTVGVGSTFRIELPHVSTTPTKSTVPTDVRTMAQ